MTAPMHADAGARALNALPRDEAAAFDEHVTGCELCAVEYAEFLGTTAMLAAAVAEAPPDGLRAKVMSAAARTPQLPPLTSAAELSERRRDEAAGPGGRRQRRTPRWRRPMLLVAAVFAAALLIGGVIVVTHHSGPTPDQAAARCVADAPDAQVRHPDVGTGGSVTLARSCAAAVVHVAAMPPLPDGKEYQLWVMAGSNARSAGMIAQQLGPTGQLIIAGLRPSDTDIGISVEPAGGSKTPTTKPVWVVPLTS
jgi:anti-sigma-K factor RskA